MGGGGLESHPVPQSLMKCWANEVLVVYSVTHSSYLPLPYLPRARDLTANLGYKAAAPVEQVRNPIFTLGLLSGTTCHIPSSSVSQKM